jgi:hypothetical protein
MDIRSPDERITNPTFQIFFGVNQACVANFCSCADATVRSTPEIHHSIM